MSTGDGAPVCFIIGPIGSDGSAIRKHSDLLFHAIVEPELSSKYQCIRADMERKPGLITDAIIHRIHQSALVVADLTTLNPNVLYELGIRHAASKATIHMAAAGTDLPFDNAGNRTIFYDLADWHSISRAKADLAGQVVETERSDFVVSNPVTQALTMQAFRASASPDQNQIALLSDRLSSLERLIKEARKAQSPVTSSPEIGDQLVDGIHAETTRIARRRATIKEAMEALIADGHVLATQDEIEDVVVNFSQSQSVYEEFVENISNSNFDWIRQYIRNIIPF